MDATINTGNSTHPVTGASVAQSWTPVHVGTSPAGVEWVAYRPEHVEGMRQRLAALRAKAAPTLKLTGLTDTQMYYVEDYLSCSESCSDDAVVVAAKDSKTTSTTATMTVELAEDFVCWLQSAKSDHVDMAGTHNALTDEQVAFAERSVARSFKAMVKKVRKALGNR